MTFLVTTFGSSASVSSPSECFVVGSSSISTATSAVFSLRS